MDRIVLVARSLKKAEKAKLAVDSVLSARHDKKPAKIETFECDQSSLGSVRCFAEALREAMGRWDANSVDGGPSGLDVVCLNAAVLTSKGSNAQYTEDDMELTFQTNHLASFLLMNLIHDLVNPGGRIILTTSGLHEGPSFGGFQGIVDATSGEITSEFDMVDGSVFDYKEAYSLSKLCVTTFCVALNQRLKRLGKDVVANCFSPGLITSTGLFRHQSFASRVLYAAMMNNVAGMGSTIQWGGGALAWMVTADEAKGSGGNFWKTPPGSPHLEPLYGETFCTGPTPSEAAEQANQEILWRVSAELTGISVDHMAA